MKSSTFRMRCPKCNSTIIEIDRMGGGWNRSGEPVLRCRCGKQVFGEKEIDAEYDRQKRLWSMTRTVSSPVDERPPQDKVDRQYLKTLRQALRELAEQGRQLHSEVKALEETLGQQGSTDDEQGRLRNLLHLDILQVGLLVEQLEGNAGHRSQNTQDTSRRVAQSKEAIANIHRLLPGARVRADRCRKLPNDTIICEWKDCENPAAKTSKYCSVQCKNRFARWRHKKRQEARTSQPSPPTIALSDLKRRRFNIIERAQTLANIPHPEDQKVFAELDAIIAKSGPQKDAPAWAPLALMNENELWKQPLSSLRKYARHALQIIGASKVSGGKTTLIPLILEARKRQAA